MFLAGANCMHLVLQHQIIQEVLDGKLHLAPVKRARRVLDVGTGPGLWPLVCSYFAICYRGLFIPPHATQLQSYAVPC